MKPTTCKCGCANNLFYPCRLNEKHRQPRVPPAQIATQLTYDEAAGMAWWNNMSESDRCRALARLPTGSSVSDAWNYHKNDQANEQQKDWVG
jgi:hypothetical protein